MKITKVECFVLLIPDFRADACSSAQDNLVVKIHTDDGHTGIGETDTNPGPIPRQIDFTKFADVFWTANVPQLALNSLIVKKMGVGSDR